MRRLYRVVLAVAGLALGACGSGAQQTRPLVQSSDPGLRELAAALLPDLARRAGMELKEPVRLEKRSRAQLEGYLRHKLDEELPAGARSRGPTFLWGCDRGGARRP